ncbi:MAG: hypothetical protein V4732_16445 [Pseudomonadota bacterium]
MTSSIKSKSPTDVGVDTGKAFWDVCTHEKQITFRNKKTQQHSKYYSSPHRN